LTAFSQTDTNSATKCFPIPVVKLIIKDLLSGDSAKALLKLTEEQLDSTIKKTYIQDSIIGVHIQKEENFNTIVGYEREKFSTLKIYTGKLETDIKHEKLKTKLFSWGSAGLLLGLGVVLFILK
jgi:hypothetical protein